MNSAIGVALMVMGVIGIARGDFLDRGLQAVSHSIIPGHSGPLAALLGAFFFVGGLMILAKRDAFSTEAPQDTPTIEE